MGTTSKPIVTGTTHKLPFDSLSAADFERLCFWLVEGEGFERAEYLGEAGNEHGRDVVAWKSGRRFVFQCKRMQRFGAATARKEIAKLGVLPEVEQPHELVFVVPRAVSAKTRAAVRATWGTEETCHFWSGGELDCRVKRHSEIVEEFFQRPSADPSARLIANLPYASLGELFFGREDLFLQLHTRLAARPAKRASPIAGKAIHGLGGVGKTRLAVEYAWRFAKDYRALLFVGASTSADLSRNFAALGAPDLLGLPEQDTKDEASRVTAVLRWLASNPGWLMILDNIDFEESAIVVDALISRLHGGHILLTGRLARWSAEVEVVELGLLEERAAVGFLLARTRGKRRPAANDQNLALEIASELGFLPLALEQAGAFVAARSLTLARYLAEWRSNRDAILA